MPQSGREMDLSSSKLGARREWCLEGLWKKRRLS